MMLQKKSSGMARAKSLIVLPLFCTAVLAFAETKNVPTTVCKDSESSQNVITSSGDTTQLLLNGEISVGKTVKMDSLSVIKLKDGMGKDGKAAQIKDGVFGLPLKGSDVLYVVDGNVVKSIDNFDADKIKSITIIQDKDKMKKFGPEAEGKDAVISLTLKPYDYGNVLFVVDGEIVPSIDGIDNESIESMTVIKYRKEIEKYGKAAEGKESVIEIQLKNKGMKIEKSGETAEGKDGVIEIKTNGKAKKVQDHGNVLFVVDGKIVPTIDNIDSKSIESMTVVKQKKAMKKYGKAAKGKDGVIEIKLKK